MSEIALEQQLLAAKKERNNYILAVVLTLFFLALVAPYREVHIPSPLLAAGMLPFSLIALRLALEDFTKLLLIFVVYAPFQKVLPGDFGGFVKAFNFTNVLFIFMVFGWLYRASVRSEKIYTPRKLDLLVVVFLFLSTLSLVRGEIYAGRGEIGELIFPLKRWLTPMVIYFIYANAIKDRKELKLFVISICISTFFIGVWGWKNYYIDKGGLWHVYANVQRARIGLISRQPNELGAYFCYYSFFLLSLGLLYFKSRRGLFWLFGYLVCLRAMLLTFSRGAKLAFFAGTFITLYLWNKRVFYIFIVPIMILLVIYPSLVPDIFIGRLKHTLDRKVQMGEEGDGFFGGIENRLDKSSKGRLQIWKNGLKVVEQNALIGVGYGQFSYAVGRYINFGERYMAGSHNTYLVIAAEMGVPALMIFLSILAALFFYSIYIYRHSRDRFAWAVAIGFMGGLVGFLVSNMFGFRLTSNEIVFHFWILAAVITRIKEFTSEDVREEAAEYTRRMSTTPSWVQPEKLEKPDGA